MPTVGNVFDLGWSVVPPAIRKKALAMPASNRNVRKHRCANALQAIWSEFAASASPAKCRPFDCAALSKRCQTGGRIKSVCRRLRMESAFCPQRNLRKEKPGHRGCHSTAIAGLANFLIVTIEQH